MARPIPLVPPGRTVLVSSLDDCFESVHMWVDHTGDQNDLALEFELHLGMIRVVYRKKYILILLRSVRDEELFLMGRTTSMQ